MSDLRSTLEHELERLSPPRIPFDQLARRRDRKRRDQRIRAGALGLAVAIAMGWLGLNAIRSTPSVPADDRSEDLGIFAPAAGRIAYQRMVGGHHVGLFAIDPNAADPVRFQVQLSSKLSTEGAEPLGWSSDGTELLIMRPIEGKGYLRQLLYILHADGSETQVTPDPMLILGATISPDGSRVVFAGWTGETPDGPCCSRYALYAVDAEGGRPVVLLEPGEHVQAPTFSPDGTQIAYSVDAGEDDYRYSVWVMDADGSDAHEIVTNNETRGFVSGLTWSPAGDRIALGLGRSGVPHSVIYTFAPDGSDFTRVIAPGFLPYWSPDGSQIAYTVQCYEDTEGCPSIDGSDSVLAVADADGSHARTFSFATSGPWHPAPTVPTETT